MKSSSAHSKKKNYRLETLEPRVMLSATGWEALEPGGTQAYEYSTTEYFNANATQTFTFRLYEASRINLAVALPAGMSATTNISNSSGTVGTIGSGQTDFFSSFNAGQSLPEGIYTVQIATQGSAGMVTLDVLANAIWEKEVNTAGLNNTRSNAQSILETEFISPFLIDGNSTMKRAVVVGKLDADKVDDWYSFDLNANNRADIVFRAPGCTDLVLELYDASGRLLAKGTSTDSFQNAIDSYTGKSTATLYVRVSGTVTSGTITTGDMTNTNGRYTLTIMRNASLEMEDNSTAGMGTSLDSDTTGFGAVHGTQTDNITQQVTTADSPAFAKAIAIDGNLMAVTTCDTSSSNGRKLTIFEYDGTGWVEKASVSSSATTKSNYGDSVSFSGEYIIVGAQKDLNSNSVKTGAAYVYRYVNGTLTQVAKLAPSDLSEEDSFGTSVTISGDTAVVSAPNAVINGVTTGAVYVYKLNGNTWNEEEKLTGGVNGAAGAATTTVASNGRFGASVAYDGQYLAVGATADLNADSQITGAVYVYTRTAAGWTQVSRLLPLNLPETANREMAFGQSVAISDGFLVVGATNYHGSSSNHGAAFVYQLQSTSGTGHNTRAAWTQQAILLPNTSIHDPTLDFGCSVSVQNGKILVGDKSYMSPNDSNLTGAAFLYERQPQGTGASATMQWVVVAKLLPENESELMFFGNSVALMNNKACVGASNAGSVTTFSNFSDIDTWTVNITSSGVVNFNLQTLEAANSFTTDAIISPILEVYSPSGKLHSVYTASAGETSIANSFSVATAATGTYTFVVRAASAATCQYSLAVHNNTGNAFNQPSKLSAEGVSPASGAVVFVKPDTVTVRFSQQVLATSLASATATVQQTGGSTIVLTSATLIDGNTVQWTVPSSANILEGTLAVTLNGVTDIRGQALSTTGGANTYNFIYDRTAPTITGFTILESESQQNVPFAKIVFSEAMLENFSATNITLTGNHTGNFTVIPTYNAATNTLTLSTATPLPDDYFTLTLKSGYDGIRDLAGLSLAGDGTSSGTNFTRSFFIDTDAEQTLALPLTEVGVSGSMVWSTSAQASLSSAADQDSFILNLRQGQLLSVEVAGKSAGMAPTIIIYKVGSSPESPLATSVLCEGTAVTKDALRIPSNGDYIIQVGSEAGGSAGLYTIRANINAATELPTANDTIAQAQSLNTAFWTPVTGVTQAAVQGTLKTAADVDYYTFNLSAGLTANMTLLGEYPGMIFAVYDADGHLVTQSVSGTDGQRQIVTYLKNNLFIAQKYTIKIMNSEAAMGTAADNVGYQFVITTDAMLEQEPNDTFASGQELNENRAALGTVNAPNLHSGTHGADISTQTVDTSSLSSTQLAALGSAVSVSGDWAVLGGGNYAAIYRFVDGEWVFYQLLTPDATLGGELFAASAAISGDTLVLGATSAYKQLSDGGTSTLRTGAVFIYRLNGSTWQREAAFSPSDAEYADLFGHAVVIQGDTIAVSSVQANEPNGGNSDTGAVYILQRNDSGWQQTAKITAGDASALTNFGYSLAMQDDLLAVCALRDDTHNAGKVYLYRNVNGVWREIQTIQQVQVSGAAFGAAIQIAGQWLAISAPGMTVSGHAAAGAVYMYHTNAQGEWGYTATLTAHQPQANQYWGSQLVLDSALLFVGTAAEDTNAAVECFALHTDTPHSSGLWNSQWTQTTSGSGNVLLAGGAERLITMTPQSNESKVQAWSFFQDVDYYCFTAGAGTNALLNILAMTDGSTMTTGVVPYVEVMDASGELIHKNKSETDTTCSNSITLSDVTQGQAYYIRVSALAGTTSHYALKLSYGVETVPPTATVVSPTNDSHVQEAADETITVSFSHPVDLRTLESHYSQITTSSGNTETCIGYTVLDGQTIQFHFIQVAKNDNHEVTFTIPANILKDLRGNDFAAVSSTFIVDDTRPALSFSNMSLGNTISTSPTATDATLVLTFTELLDTSNIQASDFTLVGVNTGVYRVQSVSFSTTTQNNQQQTIITLHLGAVPQDNFTLTLTPSGSGIPDLAGNCVKDDFSLNFTVTYAETYADIVQLQDFEKIVAPGSMAYEQTDSGYLTTTAGHGQQRTYAITLAPNQSFTVALATADLKHAQVRVTTSTGTQVALASSNGNGQGVLTQTVTSDTNNTTTYYIYVTNTGSNAGAYELSVLLNAVAETENLSPAVPEANNDTPAVAQDITSGFHTPNTLLSDVSSVSIKGELTSTSDIDWYKFTVADGAAFSAILTDNLPDHLTLELYGVSEAARNKNLSELTEADMVRIFVGEATPGADAWIGPITNVSEPGTYFLKVSRAAQDGATSENFNAQYGILITQNIAFNHEPNDSRQAAQSTGNTTNILGYVATGGTTLPLAQQEVLSTEDVRNAGEGYAVATNGNVMLVGAPGSNRYGEQSGAVSLYQYDGTKWLLMGYLEGSNVSYFDRFGSAVAISGNTAVVSATGQVNINGTTGAVYVFEYDGAAWTQTDMLTAPNMDDGVFGTDVAISGDRLVIGSPGNIGAAYVYTRLSGSHTWQLEATLQNLTAGSTNSRFGAAVAICGTTVVVGAPQQTVTVDGVDCARAGAVYVYQRATSGNNWQLAKATTASAPKTGALFGTAVDVQENVFLVGAPGETVADKLASGAAYWFTRSTGNVWELTVRLTQADPTAQDNFGCSAALEGGMALVGSSGSDESNTTDTGAVWLFQASGDSWTRSGKLTSQQTSTGAAFGTSLDLANGVAVIGAPNASSSATGIDGSQHPVTSGSAYVFGNTTDADYYYFTGNSTKKITVTLTLPGYGIGEFQNSLRRDSSSLVKLYSSSGAVISHSNYSNNVWTFDLSSSGQGVYLAVSADAGYAGEYFLSVEGVAPVTPTAITSPTSSVSTTQPPLSVPPAEISLTFNVPIRGDLVNLENISIDTGAGIFHPSGIHTSADGKTITLEMNAVPYFSSAPTISIPGDTFYGTDGQAYTDAISGGFNIIINTVKVKTQVKASEDETLVTWTFAEEMNIASLNWDDFLAAFQVLDSNGTNLATNSLDFIHVTPTSVTWRSVTPLPDGTTLTARLDGRILCASSGAILDGMTDGVLRKSLTINLSTHVEAALSVQKTPSAINSTTGEASQLPASVTWVDEWQSVWVEVWAYVYSGDNQGLMEIDAVISYDPSLFVPATKTGGAYDFVASAPFSGSYGEMNVTAGAGNTLILSGSTTRTDVGDNGSGDGGQYAMIGRVRFSPNTESDVSEAGVRLDTVNKIFTPADSGFRLTDVSGVSTTGGSINGEVLDAEATGGITGIYPVSYDLNDSGKIDIYDLIQFAKVYAQVPSTSNSDIAWAADFNKDGIINIYDLIQFAKNYGKSRSTGGISLPDTLTSDWGYAEEFSPGTLAVFASTISEEVLFLTTEEVALLTSLGMTGLIPTGMIPAEAVSDVAAVDEVTLSLPDAMMEGAARPDTLTTTDPDVLASGISAAIQTAPQIDVSVHRYSGNVLAAEMGNVKWIDMNGSPREVAMERPLHRNDTYRHRFFAEEPFTGETADGEEDEWLSAILES